MAFYFETPTGEVPVLPFVSDDQTLQVEVPVKPHATKATNDPSSQVCTHIGFISPSLACGVLFTVVYSGRRSR